MLALGAQILLGFELTGVFREGFESLPLHARYLDGVALVLMTITLAFLITPETHHQIVDVGADTGTSTVNLAHGCLCQANVSGFGPSLTPRGARGSNCWRW
jgi:hypothetical protein